MFHPIKHFITITKHRNEVIRLCFKAGIGFQGLFHDLSKYSPTEFIPGAKYYMGDQSPNNGERIDKGYSLAWMHHKGRNKHHFEFWYDYEMETKKLVPIDMPDRYIKEMFCDRVAASKTYNKLNYTQESPLSSSLIGSKSGAMLVKYPGASSPPSMRAYSASVWFPS